MFPARSTWRRYVPPEIGVGVMEELARKKVAEVWLNLGAMGPAVIQRARQLGLATIQACSIIGSARARATTERAPARR